MSAELTLAPGFLDRWRDAGLGGELAEILKLHHVAADRLREQAETERRNEAQAFKDRQKSLARGVATKKAAASPLDALSRDVTVAHRELVRQTVRGLKELGDRPIRAELQPAHAALLDEARPLAELCDGIRTDAEIMRPAITAEAREAWVRLGELWHRREALAELLMTLVADRVVPTLSRRYEGREYRIEMFPERRQIHGNRLALVRHDPRRPPASPAWMMAECVLDRHKVVPALLTAEDMQEAQRQAQQEVWRRGDEQEAEAKAKADAARLARQGRPSAGEAAVAARELAGRHQYEQAARDAEFVAALRSKPVPAAPALPAHLAHLRSGMPGGPR